MARKKLTEAQFMQGIPKFMIEIVEKGSGWATFRHPDNLSGKDWQRLREAVAGHENLGKGANAFMQEALGILIDAWEVPGKPGLAIPRGNQSANLQQAPARMLASMERHIQPYLDFIRDGDENEEEQDPTQPESE